MVAIYARRSVFNQDSISVETQVCECKKKLYREDKPIIYQDNGFSGKDTNRPDFTRMMEDIETGQITKVIVYKFDRISRSVLDFLEIMKKFSDKGISFISYTENFDTSTTIGQTVVKILVVFAEYERQLIVERVRGAYLSRSQHGFFMGGPTPYGFKKTSVVIDGINTAMFVPEPEEVEVIKTAYSLYSKPNTSIGKIIDYFNENNITRRGSAWARSRVAEMLKSALYVEADEKIYDFFTEHGAIIPSDKKCFDGTHGCYYFKGDPKAKSCSKWTSIKGNYLVIAPHEGFISSDVWLKCRIKMLCNSQIKTQPHAKNTWLAGKIKCGVCGYALTDKLYKDRNIRYLICSRKYDAKTCSGPGTLHTDEVEQIVFEEVKKRLCEFSTLGKKSKEEENPEISVLKKELLDIEKEKSGYVKRIAEADDLMFNLITNEVHALESRKSDIYSRISGIQRSTLQNVDEVKKHVENWDSLSFDDKRAVLDVMVKVIKATSKSIEIEWRY